MSKDSALVVGTAFAFELRMAPRIDMLGSSATRELLVGRLLETVVKSELDEIVATAAQTTSAPASVVSLMGKRSVFMIAGQGLAPELAAAGVTDRSVSFCQKTVRDNRRTEWEDASLDENAPQAVVEAYGIRSYLGVPVVVDEVVVGALCVVDTVARRFSPEQRHAMDEMGLQVSRSLQASLDRAVDLHDLQEAEAAAVEPVFGELRNVLGPLGCGIGQATLSHHELQGALRALTFRDERLQSILQDTLAASTDLDEILRELAPSAKRLSRSIMAMESLFDRTLRLRSITECVANASTLAEHLTKLVGGVRVEPSIGADVKVSARSVVPAIALVLGAGARRLIERKLSGGLRIKTVETNGGGCSVLFFTPHWEHADIMHCVRCVTPLLNNDQSWMALANADSVELRSCGDTATMQ